MTAPSPQETAESLERLGAFGDRDAWAAEGWCRIERSLQIIGTRSAMILVRELFYGATRFEELTRRTGLSDAVVAARLKQLHSDGIVSRRPYREPGKRTRAEYVLTDRGRTLFPVLVGLMEWGEELRDDHRTGVEWVHRDCEARLAATVTCTAGHPVGLRDAAVRIKDEDAAIGSTRQRAER